MKSKTHQQEQDKARRREEGAARNAAWQALTPVQQLESLNNRGLRAARQRARLSRTTAKKLDQQATKESK